MQTYTPMTEPLLKAMQARGLFVETHVHFPGLFTPELTLSLGIKNGWVHGHTGEVLRPFAHPKNPYKHYSELFLAGADGKGALVKDGMVAKDLRYNLDPRNYPDLKIAFDIFDRVYAFTHSHRFGEGAVMQAEDVAAVMASYLGQCREQGLRHTEVQFNFTMADHVFRDSGLKTPEARQHALCELLAVVVEEYAKHDVNLAFLHCFNKTVISGIGDDLEERTVRAADLVLRLNRDFPFVVGIQSAGNEDMYDVEKLKRGYDMVRAAGLESGAHAGEGRGGPHVMKVLDTLQLSNLGHGFRAIELDEAIAAVREAGMVLHQCPIVNRALESKLKYDSQSGKPHAEGEKRNIGEVYNHPFFELLRSHGVRVNICSDNPGFFGSYEEEVRAMTGMSVAFPKHVKPLSFEELVITTLNGVMASAMKEKDKLRFANDLNKFVVAWQDIQQMPTGIDYGDHPLLERARAERMNGGGKAGGGAAAIRR
ncbi:MAG: hypothetical protein EB060_04735 [Proteobacteria bacterium]|nr:hypothetical protein [Pseudomonadota bacterium]